MQTISVLPDEVINQIAAGEVIENPASAIKELVENSLDAGAENIRIEIKNGGLQLIRIEDDGSGMSQEDAKLSILRHATSKIKLFDDLQRLNTMGFRGEALASIASISKMEIKTSNEIDSTFLKIEAGKILSLEKCARTKGTTIDIKSLFYNVPVRKSFQKSQGSIAKDIQRMIINLSLANPQIGITFISNDQVVFCLEKQDSSFEKMLETRIIELFGKDFFNELLFVFIKEDNFSMSGYIAKPTFVKKNKSSQYLFVNNRAIYSYRLSQFIKEGYSTRIQEDDHPPFVLHFELAPSFVDVNVHPQKKEIRLKDEFFIKQKIESAISSVFEPRADFIDPPFFKEGIEFNRPQNFSLNIDDESKASLQFQTYKKQLYLDVSPDEINFQSSILFDHFLVTLAKELPSKLQKEQVDGFAVFDLLALEARILFDQLKIGGIKKQELALPLMIDIEPDQMLLIEANLPLLSELGFEIRIMALRSIALDAIPYFINERETPFLLQNILFDLQNVSNTQAVEHHLKMKLAQNICRFAKSKKRGYTKEIAIKLIDELIKSLDPFYDPLGKKIFIFLQKIDLDNFFKG
ncbi:MAG: DNA mismatch repair endonuclease MutL [Chlamydiae bacterium]|nr:DNA mismatch repair endonuclease MutL [Chlamydiota bacterium]